MSDATEPRTEAIAALETFLSSDADTRGTVLALRPDLRERLERHVREWLAEARSTPAEPLDAQPRDTPHLVRDGDRRREHPSEARLAVTDAGPRSESRSSGGWQGGPSGADIDRAIAIIEDSRQTHVNWAEWRRKGNGTDTDHEMIGDLEWHENAIRDYDHVLSVLRSARSIPAEPDLTEFAASLVTAKGTDEEHALARALGAAYLAGRRSHLYGSQDVDDLAAFFHEEYWEAAGEPHLSREQAVSTDCESCWGSADRLVARLSRNEEAE